MIKTRHVLVSMAIAAAVTACGHSSTPTINESDAYSSNSSSSASPSSDPNTLNLDDATWLNMMNAHHQQAIDMSDFALSQSKNQEIKDLATAIRAAQYPELEYMNGLLQAGGYKDPIDVSMHMSHMQGMLSAEELAALSALTGSDFDKAFLTAMITHHEGAVSMSENMLVSGTNSAVKELAGKIVDTQNQEIVKMQVMLGVL